MPSKPAPTLKHRLAMAGITLGALVLFLGLRPDVIVLAATEYHNKIATPHLIDEYLKNNTVRKVQVGSGTNNFAGWLNTDLFPEKGQAYMDVTKPFPFPDASVDYIFGEHVIEHITFEQAITMLKECHRVLKPGGKLRLATPNLLKFVALFDPAKSDALKQYMQRKQEWHEWPNTADPECYILNKQLREWGHQFVYTPKELSASYTLAGFHDPKEFHAGESEDGALLGLESRTNSNVRDINLYETMVIQATRE